MSEADLDALATEGRLPESADLDLLDTRAQLALMARQDRVAVDAVAATHEALAKAVDSTVARMRRGGRLIEVGAGTPGRLAMLDAAECGPTFGVDGHVVALMAGGPDAFTEAAEQGEDDEDAGADDVRAIDVRENDVVVAVSASGRTPYVLGAIGAARDAGALTIAVVNNPGSAVAAACEIAIEALTGPEVVSGSTRLKAGTAAKLVLNTLSTLVMVQLGHTFGDLMVGLRAGNAKLQRRAERIVRDATGATDADAGAALSASGGDVKVAAVMLLAGVDAAAARMRLDAAGGHVRAAVQDVSA
jgi:N-acetylmuramic acid 6-phosphate etherase